MSTLTVIPIETPTLGDRSYLVHDGEVAFVVDPQRDIDRVLALLDDARRTPHPRLRDPHPQRLRHRRVRPRAGHRCPLPRQRRGRRVLHSHPRSGRTGRRGGWTHARHRAGNPRPHVHPPLLCPVGHRRRARRGGRRVLRRLAALRRHRTARPAGCGAHARPGAPPARVGAPARGPAPRRGRGLPDPRLRLLLLGHPVGRDVLDHRPREVGQPSADPGRADVRRRAAGRPRSVAGLLRPHGAGQRRGSLRSRPQRAGPRRRGRAPPADRRRRMGRRPAQPHRLRRRSRARHAQLRPRRGLRDLPRLAGRLGRPDHPARRDRRRRGPGAAGAGPDRHRPSGRPRDRQARGLERPRAELVRDGDLRRPGARTPPPRGGRPGRAPRRRARGRAHRRCRQHPAPRARATGWPTCPPGEVWVHCAGGYRASVAASMLDAAGRMLVAIDDSFDNAEDVGLHLVGPAA